MRDAENVNLTCPDETARPGGEATYGNVTKTFDKIQRARISDTEPVQTDAIVLPSQIECTYPSGTKFQATETLVTCLWIADPSISCQFVVNRGAVSLLFPVS